MADRDISADESVLLHGADQRLYDLFRTARLAFKGDLSLVAAAADAPDTESLGKHTCQTMDASVLDQVVKRGERKEDFGFLQKTSGVRRNIVKGKALTDQALDLLYAKQNLGPVDKESRMTIFYPDFSPAPYLLPQERCSYCRTAARKW